MADLNSVLDPQAPVQATAGVRPRPRWLTHLALVLLIELAVLLQLVPQDPALRARFERLGAPFRQMQRTRHLASLTHGDPAGGSRLLPLESPVLRTVREQPGKGAVLLVFIGPCTSCIAGDIQRWQALQAVESKAAVLFIGRDSQEAIDRFTSREGVELPMVADPDGSLAASFNAIWTPRAYALDREGIVRWIQPDDSMTPTAIAAAVWGYREKDPT